MSWTKYLKEVEENKNKQKEQEIKGAILDFFTNNPNPDDESVHKMADGLGIEKDKFEKMIYSILSSFLSGGLRNKVDKEKLNVEDEGLLKKAIDIETEHTDNTAEGKALAKLIVLDHVAEYGWDYYRELIKMEDNLKNKKD